MTTMLPREMDYSQTHAQLPPNMVATQIVLSPTNGSTFLPSNLIQLDYLSRGYIVPDSIFVRYKVTHVNTAVAQIIGTPCFTFFSRNETIIGSSVCETISQYNQVANMLTNLTQSVSGKYGVQSAYGYTDNVTTAISMSQLDGRTVSVNEVISFSCPLPGLLTNCEKLIPAFAMPQIRTQLTIDSITNIYSTVPSTGFTISNFELCYTMLDAGPNVENITRQLGSFHIKSQSITNSSVTLASGTSGSVSLVFNQRLASVKSAFVLFTGTTSNSVNKWCDSYDPTSNTGEISINVGGISYPARPLSFANNKAGMLQTLRQAIGSIYDKNNELSINAVEWNKVGNDGTSSAEPAKMIVGVPLEVMHCDALLTGISTQNSAITVLLTTTTATAQAHTVNLLLSYDALIEVDVNARQVSVKM